MEIEKLIKHMRKEAHDYRSGRTLGRAFADAEDVLDEAATALEQLQAESDRLKEEVQQTRWIPVEERLPEQENTQVLMTDGERHYISSRNNMVRFLDCEGIFIPGKAGAGVKVTHWMPLPQPPKEGTNGKH